MIAVESLLTWPINSVFKYSSTKPSCTILPRSAAANSAKARENVDYEGMPCCMLNHKSVGDLVVPVVHESGYECKDNGRAFLLNSYG